MSIPGVRAVYAGEMSYEHGWFAGGGSANANRCFVLLVIEMLINLIGSDTTKDTGHRRMVTNLAK